MFYKILLTIYLLLFRKKHMQYLEYVITLRHMSY